MPTTALKQKLAASPEFERLLKKLDSGGQVTLTRLAGSASSLVLACLIESRSEGLVVCVDSLETAANLRSDLLSLLQAPESSVLVLPPAGRGLYKTSASEPASAADRAEALASVTSDKARTLVVPARVLLEKLPPPSRLSSLTWQLHKGDELPREALVERLEAMGYMRCEAVHEAGDFAVRGFIVDFFTPTASHPTRVEYFDDVVDSLRSFDVTTQRSIGEIDEVLVCPATPLNLLPGERARLAEQIRRLAQQQAEELRREGLSSEATRLSEWARAEADLLESGRRTAGLERYTPLLFEQPATLLDYCLQAERTLCLLQPEAVAEELENRFKEARTDFEAAIREGRALKLDGFQLFDPEELASQLESRARLVLEHTLSARGRGIAFQFGAASKFHGKLDLFAQSVAEWQQQGLSVVVTSPHPARLRALLEDYGLESKQAPKQGKLQPGALYVDKLDLAEGFTAPNLHLVVLTELDLLGSRRPPGRERRTRDVPRAPTLAELKPGDYVVHVSHGIGIYRGLVKRHSETGSKDYLEIEYKDGGKLFVSSQQMDRIQRYVGASSEPPALNSLEDVRWRKAKRRARKQALEIADRLVKLQAQRQKSEGFAAFPDDAMQRQLEARFPFVETEGQLAALEAVKRDMEKARPMDRLVCGDVGFGKTEVAVRAAFKAVLSGKQVAVLVPTTVLAEQHYNTFRDRFAGFPVRVETLSRFRSRKQQNDVLRGLRTGSVDVVIGTHRLLSKDVEFKDLGLLIIDEEHRFGVLHKEKLKELRHNVDVLTLTATPIPRTMQQALAGLVELSTITDAPPGRLAVETYVEYESDEVIKEALQRELDRGGQVYFVTDTVRSAPFLARRIRKLVPAARVVVGHGQLPESELEKVMFDFYQGEADVLVCTTIIESGLDVPNANTLLVHNADNFGLAQLYQLRGRIGRSRRQAYAYFLVSKSKRLRATAAQRLEAIQQYAQLGSGLSLAMRDLEIRGAGNLLGREQHGFINAVGLELYLQMIQEAVEQLQTGRLRAPAPRALLELEIDARLPEDYVPSASQRLALYREISGAQSVKDLHEIAKALRDRYGPLPLPAKRLLEVASLTLRAAAVGIEALRRTAEGAVLQLDQRHYLSERLQKLMNQVYAVRGHEFKANIEFKRHQVRIVTPLSPEAILRIVKDIVSAMEHKDFKQLVAGGLKARARNRRS